MLQDVAEKVERCPASRRFHHFAQALKFIETEEKALARGSVFYVSQPILQRWKWGRHHWRFDLDLN
jgi:hypothetical protein